MTRYFGCRATLVLMLLNSQQGIRSYFSWLYLWFIGAMLSYNYGSGRAISLAVEHVLRGPEFFVKNIDTGSIRTEIADFSASEKMLPFDLSDIEVVYHHQHDGRLRRLWRILTMNGFLLPSFMIRNRRRIQIKHFNAVFRDIFRYREVAYYHEVSGTGYVTRHDKKQFFTLSFRFFRLSLRLVRAMPRLRSAFRDALPEMTSQNLEEIYETEISEKK